MNRADLQAPIVGSARGDLASRFFRANCGPPRQQAAMRA